MVFLPMGMDIQSRPGTCRLPRYRKAWLPRGALYAQLWGVGILSLNKSNIRPPDGCGGLDVILLERNGIVDEEATDLAFESWLSSQMIPNLAPRCISYGLAVAGGWSPRCVWDILKLRSK